MDDKAYLGDSVYATYDGNGIILTTEDGYVTDNIIYLEPEVYAALCSFVARLKENSDGV